MRWRNGCLVFTVGLALGLSGCATDGEDGVSRGRTAGGSAIIAVNTEPETMNPFVSPLAVSTELAEPLLNSPFDTTPDGPVVSELLAREPEVTENPMTVTYHIDPDAKWSDGTPVTSADFVFTWRTVTNPKWSIVSRTGLDLVERAEAIDATTVRFHFSAPFAAWMDLFTREGVLPAHELKGEDFNTAWSNRIAPTSGPFQFEDWRLGHELVLTRNDRWWGEGRVYLDRVVFRFIPETAAVIQALRGDEIDVAFVDPESAGDILGLDDIKTDIQLPIAYDALFFGPGDTIPLDVRRAIAHALDRAAIAERILGDVVDQPAALDNALYVSNQDQYVAHFDRYAPAAGEAPRLEDEGCRPGSDGILVCDGNPLSYELLVVSGRESLEVAAQIIKAQLREIGIDVRIRLQEQAVVGGKIAEGDFELGLLQISRSSDEPHLFSSLFACGGLINYCNRAVDRAMTTAQKTLDPARRAELYNEADAAIADDLPLLPLYQRAVIVAWDETLVGPAANPRGPLTWNVEDWYLTE